MRIHEREALPQATTRVLRQVEEEEEEKLESTGLISRQCDQLADLVTPTGSKPNCDTQMAALRRSVTGRPCDAASTILRLQRIHGNQYTKELIVRAAVGNEVTEVAPEVEETIQSARGGGQALDSDVRRQMESVFNSDFGGVRVHTDGKADALNRNLSARAFTTGQDIFFKQTEYSPGSSKGRELLAHELTHVMQQNGDSVHRKLTVGRPNDRYEQEANRMAEQVMTMYNRHLLRQAEPEEEETETLRTKPLAIKIFLSVQRQVQPTLEGLVQTKLVDDAKMQLQKEETEEEDRIENKTESFMVRRISSFTGSESIAWIERAVRFNAMMAPRLGWIERVDEIVSHFQKLGYLPPLQTPNEEAFAWAVGQYQSQYSKISEDGVLGPNTWGRLRADLSGGDTIGQRPSERPSTRAEAGTRAQSSMPHFVTKSGVILTSQMEQVLKELEIYFQNANLRVRISSGVRTPESQLEIIKRRAIKHGLDKKYPSLETATVVHVESWRDAWDELLNVKGFIVNPPKAATCKLGKRAGKVIFPSPHIRMKAFDLAGAPLESIEAAVAAYKKDGGPISQILPEPVNNCVHIGIK